jgi:hypothetical protein
MFQILEALARSVRRLLSPQVFCLATSWAISQDSPHENDDCRRRTHCCITHSRTLVVGSSASREITTTNEIRYWRCWQPASNDAANSRFQMAILVAAPGQGEFRRVFQIV